jgi:hypothetical protein
MSCLNTNAQTVSECTSPKDINFKLNPKSFECLDLAIPCTQPYSTNPELSSESPGINIRKLKRTSSTISGTSKSFLARAREKTRNSLPYRESSCELEESLFVRHRCLTFTDGELETSTKYQTRVSLDSPLQNQGDYELIEN